MYTLQDEDKKIENFRMDQKILYGIFSFVLGWLALPLSASHFSLQEKRNVVLSYSTSETQVVKTVVQMFSGDYFQVFGGQVKVKQDKGKIVLGTWGSPLLKPIADKRSFMKGRHEAFLLYVKNGTLYIAGSEPRGTAYGLLELSRLIGVSPWVWWADAHPKHLDSFTLPDGYCNAQQPNVAYRGIFINDEDWGFNPWSSQNDSVYRRRGRIGSRTYSRVFELLLRLRANLLWPAMHSCSSPFFSVKGNKEAADRFGIIIGTSHCEPMMCNANGEWNDQLQGPYDYFRNRKGVMRFWNNRVDLLKGSDAIYTLGMRGKHDGPMLGVKTVEQYKTALEKVLRDQRGLLNRYYPDVTRVPQIFIPYKEVLDAYQSGFKIPDDVTLVWCDDNYGYVSHFPTATEQARKGGNGIYYHISYWGRPHDYLWLSSVSPALIVQQMSEAYDRGIRRLWVLNVGDIKPGEYDMELFLDMAWNQGQVRRKGAWQHLQDFFVREFGPALAPEMTSVMREYYRLAFIRKPELMGNTRVEENQDSLSHVVKDINWSESEIHQRLRNYDNIALKVKHLGLKIPEKLRDEYQQLVAYPILAANEMNRKMLIGELARHGNADWAESDSAYYAIEKLTQRYNEGWDNHGKWKGIMDCHPRQLSDFELLPHTVLNSPLKPDRHPVYLWNATDAQGHFIPVQLGYDDKAALVEKGLTLSFPFDSLNADSVEIEIHLLPVHPVNNKTLRFSVALDNERGKIIDYQTHGRSEEWKRNVIRNFAERTFRWPIKAQSHHSLSFKALDEGVVLDQIFVYLIHGL